MCRFFFSFALLLRSQEAEYVFLMIGDGVVGTIIPHILLMKGSFLIVDDCLVLRIVINTGALIYGYVDKTEFLCENPRLSAFRSKDCCGLIQKHYFVNLLTNTELSFR